MRPALRRLARLALLVVMIGAVGAVLSSLPPASAGPYLSALSNLAAGDTVAAPYCNDKACVGGSRYNLSCGNVTNYHCQKFGGGICSHNPC